MGAFLQYIHNFMQQWWDQRLSCQAKLGILNVTFHLSHGEAFDVGFIFEFSIIVKKLNFAPGRLLFSTFSSLLLETQFRSFFTFASSENHKHMHGWCLKFKFIFFRRQLFSFAIYFSDFSNLFSHLLVRLTIAKRKKINLDETRSYARSTLLLTQYLIFYLILCSVSWSLSNYDDKKFCLRDCLLIYVIFFSFPSLRLFK